MVWSPTWRRCPAVGLSRWRWWSSRRRAAGKSALVDAVLGFVPPEDLVRYSAMTGQSLFYMGGGDLAHKVLAVAEEEGAVGPRTR